MKKGEGIISREELTALLFWSLLHFQPGCDYSQIMLSGNKSQMQQLSSSSPLLLSFFSFLFSFSLCVFFFWGGRERWCVPDTAVLAHPSGI